MDCASSSSLFLRSNGSLVCWDDAGSNHVLQPFESTIDYAKEVVFGPVFDRIRSHLATDQMPFPDVCRGCLALRLGQPLERHIRTQRRIKYLQVEPSFACQLKCPNCYPGVNRSKILPKTEAGHLCLDFQAYAKFIRDLQHGGARIDLLEFQGHGEPLINAQIWDMIRLSRELFPDTNIRVVTNACFDYESFMVETGVSEIWFSIDGIDQESYEPYRKNGRFMQAYKFMSKWCADVVEKGLPIRTFWKYILFEHNSSDDQLIHLLNLARAAKVTDLQLIVTQMGPRSPQFFRAITELQVRAGRQKLDELARVFEFPVPISVMSDTCHRILGKTPVPAPLAWSPKPRVTLFSYMTLGDDLLSAVDEIRALLAAGRGQAGGEAVADVANKLWRLYDGRRDALLPEHAELIRSLITMLDRIPRLARQEVLLKLSTFSPESRLHWKQGFCFNWVKLHHEPMSGLVPQGKESVYHADGSSVSLVIYSSRVTMPRRLGFLVHRIVGAGGRRIVPRRILFGVHDEFDLAPTLQLGPGFGFDLVKVPPCRRAVLDLGDFHGEVRVENLAFVEMGRAPTAIWELLRQTRLRLGAWSSRW